MKYFVFILLLVVELECFAEEKKPARFHVALDYHYYLGLRERCDLWTSKRDKYNKMRGNALYLILLYNINSRLSAGAGMGFDGYKCPIYDAIPLFATVRYRPLKKTTNPYLYTSLGYGVVKSANQGWHWDAGIGYSKMFRRYFGVNCQFGYNLKDFYSWMTAIDEDHNFYDRRMHIIRHSLSFGVGLVF